MVEKLVGVPRDECLEQLLQEINVEEIVFKDNDGKELYKYTKKEAYS